MEANSRSKRACGRPSYQSDPCLLSQPGRLQGMVLVFYIDAYFRASKQECPRGSKAATMYPTPFTSQKGGDRSLTFLSSMLVRSSISKSSRRRRISKTATGTASTELPFCAFRADGGLEASSAFAASRPGKHVASRRAWRIDRSETDLSSSASPPQHNPHRPHHPCTPRSPSQVLLIYKYSPQFSPYFAQECMRERGVLATLIE